MPQIKAIAFDLEGPCVNVEEFHFRAFSLAASELGLNLSFEDIVREIPNAIGGGDKLISEGIARLAENIVGYEEVLRKKRYHYNVLIESLDRIEPRPGLIPILGRLHVMDIPIAIGSLTPRNQAETLLKRSGLVDFFPSNRIVLAEDVTNLKPNPEVYRKTAELMGIDPHEQLGFEDSATGIKALVAAGSKAVGMPIYHIHKTLCQLIEEGASRIFWNWEEMNILALIANINEMLTKEE